MQIRNFVVLSVVATLGLSSTAMARGGGHGGGGWAHGVGMHGHGHFFNHFNNRFRFVKGFNRNLFLNGGAVWGWGGDWGWGGYGDSGYGNTTVVAFPQAMPQTPGVTGSTGPCKWTSETFNVPSSAGEKKPVEVVSCR
jgi:hypothetical protein